MVSTCAWIGSSGAYLAVLRCFMSRSFWSSVGFSRVYGVTGRVFGGQGCLRRDARGSGKRRQAATQASNTPENAGLMRGSEPLPSAHCGNKGRHSLWPYSPHSLPQPACGRLSPLAYGGEEAESKKLNALNFCLIPSDSASI